MLEKHPHSRFSTPAEIISKELGQTFSVDAAVFGKLLRVDGNSRPMMRMRMFRVVMNEIGPGRTTADGEKLENSNPRLGATYPIGAI
jgi:hypothetical protein